MGAVWIAAAAAAAAAKRDEGRRSNLKRVGVVAWEADSTIADGGTEVTAAAAAEVEVVSAALRIEKEEISEPRLRKTRKKGELRVKRGRRGRPEETTL